MLASRRKADELSGIKVNDMSIRLDNSMEELTDALNLRNDLCFDDDKVNFRQLNTGDDSETMASCMYQS